ncbi:MAG: MarR family transcriptional regulator [Streptosporangiaceae bacterium]|nr:MarR family transcriptional regulator [Streptosporangiaceae bacterium]MBV9855969.1 MarR family transcriptional regulator [Streptosporangiaceae bacterium]
MAVEPAALAWRSLHLADAFICDELNASLAAEAGCSLTEHDLMAWLAAAPDRRLRMADLAARLRISPGGLTRVADRLTTRGWVERGRQPGNRREVYLALTETGTRAFRVARAVHSRVLRDALNLDEQDLGTLAAIAGRLLGRLADGRALYQLTDQAQAAGDG